MGIVRASAVDDDQCYAPTLLMQLFHSVLQVGSKT